ncbi:MAG: hypothetical protein ABH865_07580 [Candidatus Omnitrophota bacterium]|nr:hypothetical protein [Candidatus Omnitrophota bacterium]
MKKTAIILMLAGIGVMWGQFVLSQNSEELIPRENTAISRGTVSSAISEDEKDEDKTAKDYIITLPFPALDTNLAVSEEAVS